MAFVKTYKTLRPTVGVRIEGSAVSLFDIYEEPSCSYYPTQLEIRALGFY